MLEIHKEKAIDCRLIGGNILETSGEVSVIPKAEKKTLTVGDMNIKTEYEGYPRVIILEGNIIENNLLAIKKDEKWLKDKIKKLKLTLEKILVLVVDESGKIYCQKKKG